MAHTTHKDMVARLSRAEGQIRALKELLVRGESHDCKTFITQVKAARSALKSVSEEYIITHLRACESLPKGKRAEQLDEAIKLLTSDS